MLYLTLNPFILYKFNLINNYVNFYRLSSLPQQLATPETNYIKFIMNVYSKQPVAQIHAICLSWVVNAREEPTAKTTSTNAVAI